jgi:hypothetical protein
MRPIGTHFVCTASEAQTIKTHSSIGPASSKSSTSAKPLLELRVSLGVGPLLVTLRGLPLGGAYVLPIYLKLTSTLAPPADLEV